MDKIQDKELIKLIDQASKVYDGNFDKTVYFERALFLSWYCSKGDCKFCFMSTQKDKIKKVPLNMAKRRTESLITETLLCKHLGWNIEFLSGGYDSYTDQEFLELIKKIHSVYGQKLWLNMGLLTKKQINILKPYTEGICGSIECITPKLHDYLCPSKPITPIANMLDYAKKQGLKTSMTIVIGLGESIKDFELLKQFIIKHNIDRITFYRLNPHKGTEFKKGPTTEYYSKWIALTRLNFPKLEIIAGSWVDKLSEIHILLKSGANNITKFPSTALFNTPFAHKIESEVKFAKRKFKGTLTKLPRINWNKQVDALDSKLFENILKDKIKLKIKSYLKMMKTNKDKKINQEDLDE